MILHVDNSQDFFPEVPTVFQIHPQPPLHPGEVIISLGSKNVFYMQQLRPSPHLLG